MIALCAKIYTGKVCEVELQLGLLPQFMAFVALARFCASPRRDTVIGCPYSLVDWLAVAPPSCTAAASPPEVRLWAYLHFGLPAVRFLVVK